MTKALSTLKKMIYDFPLAGIHTRVKLYPVAFASLTSANASSPVIKYTNIDQYEHFWCTGIYSSYLEHINPSSNASPLISVTDAKSGDTLLKQNTVRTAGNVNFVPIQGNIPPGEIKTPFPTAEGPFLPGYLEVDYVFLPQAQIVTKILHPGSPTGTQFVDVVYFGYSIKVIRDV
jgi:hypothetical protein